MTRAQVQIGKIYAVKVSGKIQPVKITSESPYGGWNGINVWTKRDVRIRSAAKLRHECTESVAKAKRCLACANCAAVIERKAGISGKCYQFERPGP